jgi:hypothetical protein
MRSLRLAKRVFPVLFLSALSATAVAQRSGQSAAPGRMVGMPESTGPIPVSSFAIDTAANIYRLQAVPGQPLATLAFLMPARSQGAAIGGANNAAQDDLGNLYVVNTSGNTRIWRIDPYSVDPQNNAKRIAVIPEFLDVRAITFDDTRTLYAIVDRGFGLEDELYVLDPVAEVATFVGTTHHTSLQSLTFRDGLLYSYDLLAPTGLVTIDRATGESSLVGPSGTSLDVQGLTFDRSGRLFGGREIWAEFDPSTGAILSTVPIDGAGPAPSGIDPRGFEVPLPITRIGFETEDDDLTLLVNGQDVQSGSEFGRTITANGDSGHGLPAAIFDSSPDGPNAGSSDPDLLVGRGNILILQENAAQSVPGIFDLPDDDALGGSFTFGFPGGPVTPVTIDLVDICPQPGQQALVTLVDLMGRTRSYHVPPGWTGDAFVDPSAGWGRLDLRTLADQPGFVSTAVAVQMPGFVPEAVVELRVALSGSGGLDEVRFLRGE